MTTALLIVIILLLLGLLCFAIVAARRPAADLSPVLAQGASLEKLLERAERTLADAGERSRQEAAGAARELRSELQASLRSTGDSLVQSVGEISKAQQGRLDHFSGRLDKLNEGSERSAAHLRHEVTQGLTAAKEAQDRRLSENAELLQKQFDSFGGRLAEFGQQSGRQQGEARAELMQAFAGQKDSVLGQLVEMSRLQKEQLDSFGAEVRRLSEAHDAKAAELRAAVEAKLGQLQADSATKLEKLAEASDRAAGLLRKELADSLAGARDAQDRRLSENSAILQKQFDSFGGRLSEFGQQGTRQQGEARAELMQAITAHKDSVRTQLVEMAGLQKQHLDSFAGEVRRLSETTEAKSGELRGAVEAKLGQLQADNAAKLEEMRRTVDEKLQSTLEKRLGESFKFVSDRLEQVHRGLGEMQSLASNVGDLKRVLTNVKTRGTWGEVQLGSLLAEVLTPEQFAANVAVKPGSRELVEFAIRLPGKDETPVWIPIDAKFPKEDYERLVLAEEKADPLAAEQARKDLEARVRAEARNIRDKYISPPCQRSRVIDPLSLI